MNSRELHLISDGNMALETFAKIAGAVHEWVSAVHIREKKRTVKEICLGVDHLLSRGVPLEKIYINDRVDVAWTLGVKGVHLAGHSLEPDQVKGAFPRLRVGRSVHSVAEAVRMQRQGADYLVFGHIFASQSKPGLKPRGLAELAQVAQSVTIPVMAIGGVTPEKVESVVNAGASGIAVLSGILQAGDPQEAAKRYAQALFGEEERNAKTI
ncbi:thiazole tautomerase TenI [Aneurinibacillus sp. Ricciae_BoGa-3]|uniref:thiazole tautomerase TenI n=1 Tax=Aneurinibacillus sp. Ricciae_BoGa-3 TaxID=3022697 RepID=UPI002340A814|nr:thiazole tautomerase TenI [Aneurinibacillus sp. Ricciae_BoGa-3]WCK56728.1 thiazole tautomerase TenI [Aneurinibacillus sp. Ricciae_BoGa-3]